MLHIATCLWDANRNSQSFSRCYDESWAEKLYRGFKRNLLWTEFKFVVFTDRDRTFNEPIEQRRLTRLPPDYGSLIEPFVLNEDTIVVGLDTIIVGDIEHMLTYFNSSDKIALPRDPYRPERSINPIVFVPAGNRRIFDEWRGENDMEWLRKQDCIFTDDLFPEQIVSLKFHRIRDVGLGRARIVYFHGNPKPPELMHLDWVKNHWR